MKIISPTESFWDFSNHLYREPGVEQVCLELQDQAGADVNMILFACWYGATRGRFPQPLFKRALQFSSQWNSALTSALRQGRRWMKETPPDTDDPDLKAQFVLLREEIIKVELQAEQFHENMLESLVTEPASGLPASAQSDAALYNLEHYAKGSGLDMQRCAAPFRKLVANTLDALGSL